MPCLEADCVVESMGCILLVASETVMLLLLVASTERLEDVILDDDADADEDA